MGSDGDCKQNVNDNYIWVENGMVITVHKTKENHWSGICDDGRLKDHYEPISVGT